MIEMLGALQVAQISGALTLFTHRGAVRWVGALGDDPEQSWLYVYTDDFALDPGDFTTLEGLGWEYDRTNHRWGLELGT